MQNNNYNGHIKSGNNTITKHTYNERDDRPSERMGRRLTTSQWTNRLTKQQTARRATQHSRICIKYTQGKNTVQ